MNEADRHARYRAKAHQKDPAKARAALQAAVARLAARGLLLGAARALPGAYGETDRWAIIEMVFEGTVQLDGDVIHLTELGRETYAKDISRGGRPPRLRSKPSEPARSKPFAAPLETSSAPTAPPVTQAMPTTQETEAEAPAETPPDSGPSYILDPPPRSKKEDLGLWPGEYAIRLQHAVFDRVCELVYEEFTDDTAMALYRVSLPAPLHNQHRLLELGYLFEDRVFADQAVGCESLWITRDVDENGHPHWYGWVWAKDAPGIATKIMEHWLAVSGHLRPSKVPHMVQRPTGWELVRQKKALNTRVPSRGHVMREFKDHHLKHVIGYAFKRWEAPDATTGRTERDVFGDTIVSGWTFLGLWLHAAKEADKAIAERLAGLQTKRPMPLYMTRAEMRELLVRAQDLRHDRQENVA